MMKWFLAILGLIVLAGACLFLSPGPGMVRQSGPFRQDAYVWQRAWTPPVHDAIQTHGTNFTELTALAAEVSWKRGDPEVVRPVLDFAVLRSIGRPVGLALRIGPFPGPFHADDDRARWLANLAASLLAEAKSNAVPVAELQIDFDCAESKLEGYRLWIGAIRGQVGSVPVVFTALPAWLKRAAFAVLARSADGFVLQVHSLERPSSLEARFALCDPAQARLWVERAARVWVPFRVALPTYGYLVAFDRGGRFVGLAAETAAMNWPEGVQLREVRSDGAALADLVAGWMRDRPGLMDGVIWYRLPVAGDERNWSWITLASVMAGRQPLAELFAAAVRPRAALVEVTLENRGSADLAAPVAVALRWPGGRLVAADGLGGFELTERGPHEAELRAVAPRLTAGQTRKVGWLRFESETEVAVQVAVR